MVSIVTFMFLTSTFDFRWTIWYFLMMMVIIIVIVQIMTIFWKIRSYSLSLPSINLWSYLSVAVVDKVRVISFVSFQNLFV